MAADILKQRNQGFKNNWEGFDHGDHDFKTHLHEFYMVQDILIALLEEYEQKCGGHTDVDLTQYWLAAFQAPHKLAHPGIPGAALGQSGGPDNVLILSLT